MSNEQPAQRMVQCECGSTVQARSLSRHRRTLRHLRGVELNDNSGVNEVNEVNGVNGVIPSTPPPLESFHSRQTIEMIYYDSQNNVIRRVNQFPVPRRNNEIDLQLRRERKLRRKREVRETLNQLQELADDNAKTLGDGEYVRLCNLLKNLYTHTQ